MVTKSEKKSTKKSNIKLGKLKVNKETVKDLTGSQQKQIKGGLGKILLAKTVTCEAGCD